MTEGIIMSLLSKGEIIDLLYKISDDKNNTTQEIKSYITALECGVIDPDICKYIYHDELQPEEIADKILSYEPDNVDSDKKAKRKYYTYMLRCTDGSLYTGITTDIKRRMNEHFSKGRKCAKYTRNHTAKALEAVWESDSKTLASKLEYRIKKLPKDKKESLILRNNIEIMGNKIKPGKYRRVEDWELQDLKK